jgi:predicted Fe-S protein YdhL (DUF1289 family)
MKTEDLSRKAPSETTAQDAASQSQAVDEWTNADSPCVAICSTLFDDICRGCGRTVMEVSNWVFMTEEEKKEVWVRIRAEGYPRRP